MKNLTELGFEARAQESKTVLWREVLSAKQTAHLQLGRYQLHLSYYWILTKVPRLSIMGDKDIVNKKELLERKPAGCDCTRERERERDLT